MRGVHLHQAWPHFSIGYTDLVKYGSVQLGLISWVGPACGGTFALGMALFLNRLYWFGVVGLCTLGVD